MKKAILVMCLMLAVQAARAIPTLQLDINNGTYVGGEEESTITSSDTFRLQALLTGGDIGLTYYISVALVPRTGPGDLSLGSVDFDGSTKNVTGDMTYGRPPLADLLEGRPVPNLARHGIFETFYFEHAFTFSAGSTVPTYNVQDDSSAPGTSFLKEFDVDLSGLADGYNIHFDLYTYNLSGTGSKVLVDFAPFSHDAETSRNVPDGGATAMLLGLAFLGLSQVRRKLSK